jgi:hypothetical protein
VTTAAIRARLAARGITDEPATPPPPTEPPARDWDESPAEAARYDRWWGDRDTDHDDED